MLKNCPQFHCDRTPKPPHPRLIPRPLPHGGEVTNSRRHPAPTRQFKAASSRSERNDRCASKIDSGLRSRILSINVRIIRVQAVQQQRVSSAKSSSRDPGARIPVQRVDVLAELVIETDPSRFDHSRRAVSWAATGRTSISDYKSCRLSVARECCDLATAAASKTFILDSAPIV
ncbi:MAG: hypothetical protein ACI8P0_001071 [Planctomycetaceae bacterium]